MRFCRFPVALTMALVLAPVVVSRAEEPPKQPESARELHAFLVDKTMVAVASFGNNSVEYHAADGRVLGYNWDVVENIRSCWRVLDRRTVCYYYGQTGGLDPQDGESRPIETCWHYRIVSADRVIGTITDEPRKRLVGTLYPGNPRHLTDFGVSWSCNEQIVASR
ncbi:MAG: hypothetical protein LBR29_01530 [Methylobacteriaceae bacterium]|jgi:hypothetical protein|nr:hypothetical protein [Methylobacteriaceae bacterium]